MPPPWNAMLLIIGTFRLPAGTLPEARPATERMVKQSRAEDGCEGYGYAEDVLDPGLIHFTEVWRDQAFLDRHFASDHIATWRTAWLDLGARDRHLCAYDVGAPRRIWSARRQPASIAPTSPACAGPSVMR